MLRILVSVLLFFFSFLIAPVHAEEPSSQPEEFQTNPIAVYKVIEGGPVEIPDVFRFERALVDPETLEVIGEPDFAESILDAGGVFQSLAIYGNETVRIYRIREINDGNPNYTYDEQIYYVKEVVAHDAKSGGSWYTGHYLYHEDFTVAERIEFVNIHHQPEPVETTVTINKQITGKQEVPSDFLFELNGDLLFKDGTASTCILEGDQAGTYESGIIRYEHPGIYSFQVRELPGDDPDCTYDSTVYTVTDDVTTDRKTGGLRVRRVIVDQDGNGHDSIRFTNRYPQPPAPPVQPANPGCPEGTIWSEENMSCSAVRTVPATGVGSSSEKGFIGLMILIAWAIVTR